MPRGENEAFIERVGVLSEPLIIKNARQKLENVLPDEIDVSSIDVESLVDEELTFDENWENIERKINIGSGFEDIDETQIENELEKYQYTWEKYSQRHGYDVSSSFSGDLL